MSNVVTLDPALGKLLEELPAGDPDYAECWTVWTEDRQRIPSVGSFEVCLGEWYGPKMRSEDVKVFMRRDVDGLEKKMAVSWWQHEFILPNWTLTVSGSWD